jgi:hypothetical protein
MRQKENLVAANTLQPNQRIARRHLRIISIGGLRKPVQLASGQPVGVSVAQRFKHMSNVRAPVVVRSPGGSKDLQLRCTGGIQNLPCRQKQESAVKRAFKPHRASTTRSAPFISFLLLDTYLPVAPLSSPSLTASSYAPSPPSTPTTTPASPTPPPQRNSK